MSENKKRVLNPTALRVVPMKKLPDHFDVVLCSFLMFGDAFKLTVMAECRYEYWTLSIYLSLAKAPRDIVNPPSPESESDGARAIRTYLENLWPFGDRLCCTDVRSPTRKKSIVRCLRPRARSAWKITKHLSKRSPA